MTSIMDEQERDAVVEVDGISDSALDWVVGKCSGRVVVLAPDGSVFDDGPIGGKAFPFCPSRDWAQAGPLLEKTRISLRSEGRGKGWYAVAASGPKAFNADNDCLEAIGNTALEAAMRCYVKKMWGEKVIVPGALICDTKGDVGIPREALSNVLPESNGQHVCELNRLADGVCFICGGKANKGEK